MIKAKNNEVGFFKWNQRKILNIFLMFMIFQTVQAKRVIENIDYIYMHIGLQMDYPLPEEFENEKLKFEGNYKRYTKALYRKDRNDIRFTPLRLGSSVMVIKNKKNKIIHRLNIDIQKDNLLLWMA